MIKLMSLNLWNYNEFEKRRPRIIAFVRKHHPNVIALQEVRDDDRKNKTGNNQLQQLNKILRYHYAAFYQTFDVTKVHGKRNDPKYDSSHPRVKEGIGLLSRYAITKSGGKKAAQTQER